MRHSAESTLPIAGRRLASPGASAASVILEQPQASNAALLLARPCTLLMLSTPGYSSGQSCVSFEAMAFEEFQLMQQKFQTDVHWVACGFTQI